MEGDEPRPQAAHRVCRHLRLPLSDRALRFGGSAGTPCGRLRSDGDGLHGRPHIRRALQPGRDLRRLSATEDRCHNYGRVLGHPTDCRCPGLHLRLPGRRPNAWHPPRSGRLYGERAGDRGALHLWPGADRAQRGGHQGHRGKFGLAIGSAIVIGAFVGGPISGGAFNPAVGFAATLASALFDSGSWSDLWLYVVGPLVGAAAAAAVHYVQVAGLERSTQPAAQPHRAAARGGS
jgi:hypothetical protein